MMSLSQELGLRNSFATLAHESLLSIYFTGACIRKQGSRFLESYNLTEAQLNLMMMLYHQAPKGGGLSQIQLSEMMLVNRANITSLVVRMEKARLVARTIDQNDRRYNIVKLTARAKRILKQVEPEYGKEVARIMSALTKAEQKKLVSMLEKVRTTVHPVS